MIEELLEDTAPMPEGYRDDILIRAVDGSTLEGYLEPIGFVWHAKLEHVEVDEARRRTGLGSAYVREFAQRAVDSGAEVLSAEVAVVSMAKTMGRVFGPENIACSMGKSEDGVYFDFSYAEALIVLAQTEAATERHAAADFDTPDTLFSAVEFRVSLVDSAVKPYLYAEDAVQRELFGHTDST